MKTRYIPLTAGALLLATSLSHAEEDLKIYGKANISFNAADYDSENIGEWQLNSNASRLGVKGSRDLEGGLRAVYKLEYETYFDEGKNSDGGTFKQRNIYAGLEGGFGRVLAGKIDTPLKKAQGKVDRFNDLPNADIKNIMPGENRASNIVMYTLPEMSGFSATVAFMPGEDTANDNDGIADGFSASANYKAETFTATIAVDQDVSTKVGKIEDYKANMDIVRLAGEVKLGSVKLGGLYQTAEESDGDVEMDSFLISAATKISGGYVIKGQYGLTDIDGGAELTQLAIGVDKKLGKKTKVYSYYSAIDIDDVTDTTFAVGAEFKF